MKKVFSGTGLTFERTEDGNSPQPQLTRARQSSATPPKSAGLQLSPYKGSEWNEFVHYMNILAVHFAQHPDYYTEARRVELGKQYISSELRGKLQSQIIDPESLTWLSFCTLLRQQLPQTGHEVERMQNARQKTAQCVTHFALWLSSLFTLGYNDRDVREILLKGALPEIISGLQRPPTPPRDYNTLVQELQEIENAIPWRARVLPSHKTMTVSNGDGQEVPVYFATEWKEYKQFRACLERYAERCRRPHDEAFMIAVGRKHLARAFLTRWDDHANRLQEVNWFAFCVFLVEQIPSQSPGRNYWKRSQRQNQPVDLFALELLRWAPGDLDVAHDRRKHLSDRVLKELHLEANRSLGIFDEFHMFVAHLRAYQDSLSVQQRPKRRRLA
ncbi:hypothetical protein N7523_005854 [Penicillium sp. IBT 18751x]|nr:hypothetical protein N7523_005854 [Penicillium sp. IBT 18751x]